MTVDADATGGGAGQHPASSAPVTLVRLLSDALDVLSGIDLHVGADTARVETARGEAPTVRGEAEDPGASRLSCLGTAITAVLAEPDVRPATAQPDEAGATTAATASPSQPGADTAGSSPDGATCHRLLDRIRDTARAHASDPSPEREVRTLLSTRLLGLGVLAEALVLAVARTDAARALGAPLAEVADELHRRCAAATATIREQVARDDRCWRVVEEHLSDQMAAALDAVREVADLLRAAQAFADDLLPHTYDQLTRRQAAIATARGRAVAEVAADPEPWELEQRLASDPVWLQAS